jgi:hypothetical protein
MVSKTIDIRPGDSRRKFLRKACRTIVESLTRRDYFLDVNAKDK